MLLKTGFGYYVKNGKKVCKFELPIGNHPDPDEGHTWVEVVNKIELDKIILDKSDEQIVREESARNKKILADSAKQKLKTIAGLTDEEITALTGH